MIWTEFLNSTNEKILESGKLKVVKNYLKIDEDYDDPVLIACVKAAVQYIINAVGNFPEDNPAAEILLYAITQNFYENRELMQMDIQQRKRMEYTYGSLLLQLQLGGDD
jgi:uncharacterized phage protein (predicted DNA packaging)